MSEVEELDHFAVVEMLKTFNDLNSLWHDFEQIDFACLAAELTVMKVSANEQFIRKGEPATFMALLLEGDAVAEVNNGSCFTMKPGTFIGEMSMFAAGKRTASVYAGDKPVLVAVLKFDDFEEMKKFDSATAIKLQTAVAQSCMGRMRDIVERIEETEAPSDEQLATKSSKNKPSDRKRTLNEKQNDTESDDKQQGQEKDEEDDLVTSLKEIEPTVHNLKKEDAKKHDEMIFQQPNVASIYSRKSSRASFSDRRESIASDISTNATQLENELKSLKIKLSVARLRQEGANKRKMTDLMMSLARRIRLKALTKENKHMKEEIEMLRRQHQNKQDEILTQLESEKKSVDEHKSAKNLCRLHLMMSKIQSQQALKKVGRLAEAIEQERSKAIYLHKRSSDLEVECRSAVQNKLDLYEQLKEQQEKYEALVSRSDRNRKFLRALAIAVVKKLLRLHKSMSQMIKENRDLVELREQDSLQFKQLEQTLDGEIMAREELQMHKEGLDESVRLSLVEQEHFKQQICHWKRIALINEMKKTAAEDASARLRKESEELAATVARLKLVLASEQEAQQRAMAVVRARLARLLELRALCKRWHKSLDKGEDDDEDEEEERDRPCFRLRTRLGHRNRTPRSSAAYSTDAGAAAAFRTSADAKRHFRLSQSHLFDTIEQAPNDHQHHRHQQLEGGGGRLLRLHPAPALLPDLPRKTASVSASASVASWSYKALTAAALTHWRQRAT